MINPKLMEIVSTDIAVLNKDLKLAISLMTKEEAHYLVRTYYDIQEQRIAMFGRVRALNELGEPNKFYDWLGAQMEVLETRIKQALKHFVKQHEIGEWLISITGIAEVISAGLIALINVETAKTPSAVWRYAGLDPTQVRKKGEKINFCPDLKRLCYILGESFVKVKNKDSDHYGKIYQQYKDRLIMQNESGVFADTCKQILESKNFGKDTEAYKHYNAGRLPPAHIHARARRFTAKVFLCHVWQAMYWFKYKEKPKMPYIIEFNKNHTHYIEMPNCPY